MALSDPEQVLLDQWNAAKTALAAAKAAEQDLRVRVVEHFGNPEKTSGTEHVEIGEGFDLVMRKTERYVVRDSAPDFYANFLSVPAEIRNELFNVQYTVSTSYYKSNKLSDAQRQWLACLIDIKQGMPVAEIKAPKLAKVI